jgi:hypothetical protein
MNLARLALTVAKATRTNATAMQSIRDEYAAIALEVATSADAGKELTSATVNGQTFSQSTTISKAERLTLLERVVWHYDNGFYSTTRTRVFFS